MTLRSRIKKDYYAGGFITLIGLGAVAEGSTYSIGTLVRMGPGFFPVALGVILALLGIMIALTAVKAESEGEEGLLPENPEWLGWLCIVAGPVLFMALGQYAGMIPAIFACVLVSALGDKTATLKTSFVLALCVTVFGVLLFHYGLRINFPLLQWGGR